MKLQRVVWEGSQPEFYLFIAFIGLFALAIFFIDDIGPTFKAISDFVKYNCLFCCFDES